MKGQLLNMNLFDESENKYYELISYLITGKKSFTDKEIQKYMMAVNSNEIDVSIHEALFSKDDGAGSVLSFDGEHFQFALDKDFPIRLNSVEKQALMSVNDSVYADAFLKEKTKNKIASICGGSREWSMDDIEIKNQDIRERTDDYYDKLSKILEGIRTSRVLLYDNIREGKYSFTQCEAWPVRIEYSFINDAFRVCAYVPNEDRFIKINLGTMQGVKLGDTFDADIEAKYLKFMEENTKKIILEVDPVQHVIERCFRLFSFYDRSASYDSEKEKYRLELKYYRFDEAEVIRDIMSLGSNVVVIEPRGIQMKIYNRIIAARNNYV